MSAPSVPVVFGEVLFDRFPDGSRVLGGAPFNVAWHLAAFGARPAFVSRVGADEAGEEVKAAMAEWGMDVRWLQTDPQRPTGAVQVELDGGSPRFSILPDQAYDFVAVEELPAELGLQASGSAESGSSELGSARSALLYHGTLALRTEGARRALERLRRMTGAPAFLDVNLRDPWWEHASVEEWIRRARWVKLNDEELSALQGDSEGEGGGAEGAERGRDPGADSGGSSAAQVAAAERFRERFGLRAVLLTRGPHGALLLAADGPPREVAPARDVPVVDTVGAGDAFTAVTLIGLLRGWAPAVMLHRAQDFASAVVGLRGATCRDRGFYEPFLAAWQEGGKGE